MTQYQSCLMIASAAALSFALSAVQAQINSRHGTDHAVHAFLIKRIRENNFRFFVRIPHIINEAYVGALPLYLHRCAAHFPSRLMPLVEKALNPVMNALHAGLVGVMAWLVADHADQPVAPVGWAALLFALTPQFYHALSARNFGLSARGIGLLFLTSAFLAAWRVEADWTDPLAFLVLAIACYLVIAFSTFGAQALLLTGLILAVFLGEPALLAGSAAGLTGFIAVHPRYSLGYLQHTARFIHSYATALAPVYVLARRYSIWRDLVWDIWVRLREGPAKAFRYAYDNSVLVVLLLNPLALVAAGMAVTGSAGPPGSLQGYCADVALAGVAAMILTSFRATRFLGEPERYVEAISACAAIAAAFALWQWFGPAALIGSAAVFLLVDVLQLHATRVLSRYLAAKPTDLGPATRAIAAEGLTQVSAMSNNEQLTKLLLTNPWRFCYCISLAYDYAGVPASRAFAPYPFLSHDALCQILERERINICVVDRSTFETLFADPPAQLVSQRVIFESTGLRVFRLDWEIAADTHTSESLA